VVAEDGRPAGRATTNHTIKRGVPVTLVKPVVVNGVTKANAELFNEYGADLELIANTMLGPGAITESQLASGLLGPSASKYGLRKLGTGATEALPGNTEIVSKAGVEQVAVEATLKTRLEANVVAKTNITLSGTGSVLDGITLAEGNVVMCIAQTNEVHNGPWEVKTGSWVRPSFWAAASEAALGSYVVILEGEGEGGTIWVMTNTTKPKVETTATKWVANYGGSGILETGIIAHGVQSENWNLFIGEEVGSKINKIYKSLNEKGEENEGNNVGLGRGVLKNAETVQYNTIVGSQAAESATNWHFAENCVLGAEGLRYLKEGEGHIAVGYESLFKLETGNQNVAIGQKILPVIKTAYGVVMVGAEAGHEAKVASYCVGLGYQVLVKNEKEHQVAVGYRALNENTSGEKNCIVGDGSAAANKTGSYNTTTGNATLAVNTSGSFNFAGGYEALNANTTGEKNVVIGGMESNKTGSKCVAVGYEAGASGTAASSCVYLGNEAGSSNTASNMLFIASTGTTTPLILGEFPNASLQFNATKMGLFKATPVEQPKTTGTVTGVTLGKAAAPTTEAIIKEDFEKTTFTGGKGSTAYSISDIVLALKQIGALKE
jgi:hypothetical protein